MVDRTVAPLVTALEQHRVVTASLLDQLDLFEGGESAVERLVGLFTDLLREDDRALEPLVEQLANR